MKTQCDVLVIGGGAAAGKAAIAARDAGASVALVMKGAFGTSGASAYKIAEIAGYNVADGLVDKDDNPDVHYADIMRAAAGMADPKLAKTLAEGAPDSLRDLEILNIPFHYNDNDGSYFEVLGCFATKPRMHLISGHAEPIVHEQKKLILSRGIPVYEFTILTRFLVENNRIVGAMGMNRDGDTVVFHTKAIVMGTGGAGQLFSYNINPADITGDGYSLGFRAGAELINMEFMQAGPGIIYPCKNMFNSWLWALHPKVTNGLGEEFLQKYIPDMTVEECMNRRSGHYPFSNYDGSQWIDIAIQTEIKESRGTKHGGVIVDFTGVDENSLPKTPRGEELRKSWNITVNWLIENRKLDLRKTPVEVAILGHAINGGLLIDENAHTSIEGLFAAGETAGGPHGADRLGGNMILTCQVYGKRAGKSAAAFSKEHDLQPLPLAQIEEETFRFLHLSSKKGELKPHHIRKELQEIMWRYVLVTRSEESLVKAIQSLEELHKKWENDISVSSTKELMHAIETENLILIGEIIARAAKLRKETRGSHFRSDYPKRNDQEFLHRIATRLEGKQVMHRTIPSERWTVEQYPYLIVHV